MVIRIGPVMFNENPKNWTNKAYKWIKRNFKEIH